MVLCGALVCDVLISLVFHRSACAQKKLTGRHLPPLPLILLSLGEWPCDGPTTEDPVGIGSSLAKSHARSFPGTGASMEVAASFHRLAPGADVAGGPMPSAAPLSSDDGGLKSPPTFSHLRAALGESGVLAQALQDALGKVGRSAEDGTKVSMLRPL